MTIGGRIKELRKTLKKTQKEFGEAIGLKQNSVATLEMGRYGASDRTIGNICRVYNVSAVWLRTGEGEMFETVEPDEELMRFVSTILKDNGHPLNRLIRMMAHLPSEGIELVSKTVKYLLDLRESPKQPPYAEDE